MFLFGPAAGGGYAELLLVVPVPLGDLSQRHAKFLTDSDLRGVAPVRVHVEIHEERIELGLVLLNPPQSVIAHDTEVVLHILEVLPLNPVSSQSNICFGLKSPRHHLKWRCFLLG